MRIYQLVGFYVINVCVKSCDKTERLQSLRLWNDCAKLCFEYTLIEIIQFY